MTDGLLTWLCSYLLHSSLLIAGLWAAERARLLARLATSTQETLWRLALLGGLVSRRPTWRLRQPLLGKRRRWRPT
jgi:hypothetical protein